MRISCDKLSELMMRDTYGEGIWSWESVVDKDSTMMVGFVVSICCCLFFFLSLFLLLLLNLSLNLFCFLLFSFKCLHSS